MKQILLSYLSVGVGLTLAVQSWAQTPAVPTAKQALAAANAKLDAEVRDQVIRVLGTKSNTDLRPRVWDIIFYDSNRINDGVQVRVKDGGVTSVSSSIRMFDDGRWRGFSRNFSGYWPEEIINLGRWALDSDAAVERALSHSALAGYQVTEVSMELRKLSDGDVPPVWRLRLRARPNSDPTRERWVGYLQYNAETSELLKDELTIGK